MTLERLGLGGAGADIDELTRKIQQMQGTLSHLRSQQTVGNLQYGGPPKTIIGQSVWTQTVIRDVDSNTPFEFDLIVPDNLLRIHRCQVWLTPRPLRKTLSGATSGSVPSSGSGNTGAPSATVSASPSSHHHRWATWNSNTPGAYTKRLLDSYDSAYNNGSGVNIETENQENLFTNSPDEAAVTPASGAHTHDRQSHTHDAPTITLTDGVTEGTTATDMTISIDGVDRTAALGGDWDADAGPLDITQYLIDSRFIPVAGRHPIIVGSSANGAVEVTIEWEVTRRPIP